MRAGLAGFLSPSSDGQAREPVAPLLAILDVATVGVRFQHLSAFLRHHLGAARLALAAAFLLLAAGTILRR